jgi:hypothetical protein
VTFDSDTKVWRFDRFAFSESGLTSIHIPSSTEVICKSCFAEDKSLASVTLILKEKYRGSMAVHFLRAV